MAESLGFLQVGFIAPQGSSGLERCFRDIQAVRYHPWQEHKQYRFSGRVALGRGVASFEALHVAKGVPEHIASLPLLVLNDTGVIGIALFACFVAAVFARGWSRRQNLIVLGLGQVALVVALTNIATETTELMIGWLLIGLLMAACDVPAVMATEGKSNL